MTDVVDLLRKQTEEAKTLGTWYLTDNERMLRYRQMLLRGGFEECILNPYRFWKLLTEKTVFIVNLKDLTDGVGVVYGIYSTAVLWNKREWECHWLMGTSDDSIHLRFYLEIRSEEDAPLAMDRIMEFHHAYGSWGKDAILALVKEKRKAFMAQITDVLKPLGFRKKGNEWCRKEEDGGVRHFWAEKSSYSDLYGFSTAASYPEQQPTHPPYRLICLEPPRSAVWDSGRNASHLFDWQLHTKDDLMAVLDRFIQEQLNEGQAFSAPGI